MSLADKRRPALGRGMAALLSNAASPPMAVVAAAPGRALLQLAIEALERSPGQPRKRFDEAGLVELAASIREHGMVEPILVRREGGRYLIVAGERRSGLAFAKCRPSCARRATARPSSWPWSRTCSART
jgi:ParB family chromosome partitioning protein